MKLGQGGVGFVVSALVIAAVLSAPAIAVAQRGGDGAYIAGRLEGLQQQLAELSAKIEQLKTQDQQLQQRMEGMRTRIEARLERLEKSKPW